MTPQELKNSIIQLAIQGKLVEQRPEEGTGEELYRKIQAEKQKLVKAGKIRKEKPLPEIAEDEIPFDIPDSWKWIHIGDIFQHNTGKALNGSDKNGTMMTYITTSNLYWNRFELDKLKEMPFTDSEVEKCTIRKGDLCVCEGGDVGRSAIWPYDYPMRIQNHIHKLRHFSPVVVEFFYYLLYLYKNSNAIKGKGIGLQGLSSNVLHALKVPLPPLEEQKRIVAKIEEMLPLIDRYEQAWNRLEEFNKRFPGDMQKSLLQAAIQGKLVEQRPEEGTGEELYRKIQAEKRKLVEAGKIRKEKPLPEIAEDEIPFDIPDSWKWVRLGDCTSYACSKEKIAASEISSDMWSLDLEDIEKETGIIVNYCKAGDRKIVGEKVVFRKGQILYSKLRPYLKKILIAPNDGICTPELVPFSAYGGIVADYLVTVLRAPHIDFAINSVTYGVKMPRVGTETMVNLLVPLPPLEEQKRIVAKIEELLPLCERVR